MPTVISIENLSKIYRLGQIGTGTFTNDLKLWWAKTHGKPNPLLKIGDTDYGNRDGEIIWALKDISFTVEQGDVLGIIGRNGAGKSTLLKILSRVTAPTYGKAKVKGRVASLLEVGTGFHPELTGRENIYLNGAILGMNRHEINYKFDEIVDFAEVEGFIDTPVKRYSSGMYVRLAFAVAAHLEPEILLVDEVLAVGDAEFQKKCIGKMDNVAKEGRTVLFVSHNMGTIQNLCQKCILIRKGLLYIQGGANEVINEYYSNTDSPIESAFRQGNRKALVRNVVIEKNGIQNVSFEVYEDITIKITIESFDDINDCVIGIKVFDKLRNYVFSTNTELLGFRSITLREGQLYDAVFTLHEVSLKNGRYDLLVGIHPQKAYAKSRNDYYDRVEDVAYFHIDSDKNEFGIVNIRTDFRLGKIKTELFR